MRRGTVKRSPVVSLGAVLSVMCTIVACRAGFRNPFGNSVDNTAVALFAQLKFYEAISFSLMILTSSLMLETSEPSFPWSALRSDRDLSIQPSNASPAGTNTDIRATVIAMCMAFLPVVVASNNGLCFLASANQAVYDRL